MANEMARSEELARAGRRRARARARARTGAASSGTLEQVLRQAARKAQLATSSSNQRLREPFLLADSRRVRERWRPILSRPHLRALIGLDWIGSDWIELN